jgi:Outer membrane lipoprotein-sorting protein
MKRQTIWIAVLVLVLAGVSAFAQTDAAAADAAPLDVETILDRVNAAWQGDSFHGTMTLDIVLGGQTKSHKLEVWTLGEELAMIRVLEPEIDLNSGYLQLGDELWYYSPAVGSIKLPAVALGDALFGAGPSLDDLSHGTLSDDYEATVDLLQTESGEPGGFFLTLVPHADAPVVFGKLEIWVSVDYVMERLLYYDQRGDVVQEATFTDIIELGERMFSTTVIIEDAYGDKTIQRIENPQFDLELNALFFSLDTFESWGSD